MIAPTVAATAIMTARLVFGIFERSVPFASSAADVPEATAQKLDRRTSGRQSGSVFQYRRTADTRASSSFPDRDCARDAGLQRRGESGCGEGVYEGLPEPQSAIRRVTLDLTSAESFLPANGDMHGITNLLARPLPPKESLPKIKVRYKPQRRLSETLAEDQFEVFGYVGSSSCPWTGHEAQGYVRWMPPSEQELQNQVEYDMDEQDFEWLQLANAERRKEGGTGHNVPEEVFEIIMDRLEKEWFDLVRDTLFWVCRLMRGADLPHPEACRRLLGRGLHVRDMRQRRVGGRQRHRLLRRLQSGCPPRWAFC
jgi:hypothetical protein